MTRAGRTAGAAGPDDALVRPGQRPSSDAGSPGAGAPPSEAAPSRAARSRRAAGPSRGARNVALLKAAVWAVCLWPAAWLGWATLTGSFGANPIEEIIHVMGRWALVLLLATLAVTPVRRLTGWNRAVRFRRLLGLFAFFYLTLHFLTYAVLDQGLELAWIVEDVLERPYIAVGFTAFVLLIPLAVTSTRGWIRRLGKRWQTLHRLVYVAAALGVLHYYWQVKADTLWAWVAAGALAALLAARVRRPSRERRRRGGPGARADGAPGRMRSDESAEPGGASSRRGPAAGRTATGPDVPAKGAEGSAEGAHAAATSAGVPATSAGGPATSAGVSAKGPDVPAPSA